MTDYVKELEQQNEIMQQRLADAESQLLKLEKWVPRWVEYTTGRNKLEYRFHNKFDFCAVVRPSVRNLGYTATIYSNALRNHNEEFDTVEAAKSFIESYFGVWE
jgi:hypothetical protein